MASPQVNTGTSLSDVTSSIYKGAMDSANKFDKDTDEGIKKMESEKVPSPPTLTESPKPENYQSDPMQAFGSPVMWLATFGSLLTKQPLETALNSGAAVFKARGQSDVQSFKQATEKWKNDTDNAYKMANYQQELYKDVLNKDEAELRARAVSTKDNVMIHMADAKMQGQLQKDRDRNADKLQKNLRAQDYAMGKMDEAKAAGKNPQEQKEAYFTALGDVKAMESGKTSPEMSEADYNKWKAKPENIATAKAYAEGVPISDIIRGRGAQAESELNTIKKLAQEKYPDLDRAKSMQDYSAGKTALSKFESGKQGDTVRSFNVAYDHADILKGLIDALGNNDVQALNAAKQRYEQEFGSPAPTNFDAVKGIFADEINKAAVGGAGALGDREELRANISRYGSPEQLKGAVDVYKGLIVGQLQGTKRQYQQSTGREDFDRFLSPEVREDVSKRTAGKSEPKADDISYLKSHNDDAHKKKFDKVFGKGAADKALGS